MGTVNKISDEAQKYFEEKEKKAKETTKQHL